MSHDDHDIHLHHFNYYIHILHFNTACLSVSVSLYVSLCVPPSVCVCVCLSLSLISVPSSLYSAASHIYHCHKYNAITTNCTTHQHNHYDCQHNHIWSYVFPHSMSPFTLQPTALNTIIIASKPFLYCCICNDYTKQLYINNSLRKCLPSK